METRFSLPEGELHFSAGQYIWLLLELKTPDSRGSRRAFSIASASSQTKSFSIIYRVSDSQYKQTLSTLKPGDATTVIGPFGSAYLIPKREQHVTMIASGTGISPFASLISSANQEQASQLSLIYTNTQSPSTLDISAIQAIAKKKKIPVTAHAGYLDQAAFPNKMNWKEERFYICGSRPMIEHAHTFLLNQGVPRENMHFEQFYPNPQGNLTRESFKQELGAHNILLTAINHSKHHLVLTDANGQILYANPAAQRITGYTFEEMIGSTPRLWGGVMPLDFYLSFWERKHSPEGFDGRIVNRRKNGDLYIALAHISPIFNDDKEVIGYVATEEDITEFEQLQKKLEANIEELQNINRSMINRELKMIELKNENALLRKKVAAVKSKKE